MSCKIIMSTKLLNHISVDFSQVISDLSFENPKQKLIQCIIECIIRLQNKITKKPNIKLKPK